MVPRRRVIDRIFSHDRLENILGALDAEAGSGSEHASWAAATAALMRTKSPTSLKLALAQMRRGRHLSFEDCMALEFRIVSRVVCGHDMYEGVRAVIVDKDNAPRWQPARLDGVSDAMIERYFEPLSQDELALS